MLGNEDFMNTWEWDKTKFFIQREKILTVLIKLFHYLIQDEYGYCKPDLSQQIFNLFSDITTRHQSMIHHIQIKSYESLKTVLLQLGDVEEQLNIEQKNWIIYHAFKFMMMQRWSGSRFQSVSTELINVLQMNEAEMYTLIEQLQTSDEITLNHTKLG